MVRARSPLRVPMTQEDPETATGEVLVAPFDLVAGTSQSTRAKTAETFLELLGARVRNPNTRSAYRVVIGAHSWLFVRRAGSNLRV